MFNNWIGGDGMALIQCPECNKEISDSSVTCIHCGYRLKTISNKSSKLVIIIVGIAIFILCSFGVYHQYQKSLQEKNRQELVDNRINELKEKFNVAIDNYHKTLDEKYLKESDKYLQEWKRMVGKD